MTLVNRLRGNNNQLFTNQVLAEDLKKSKPIAIQGRAEIIMANNFLAKGKFLEDMNPPDGKLYKKLVGLTNEPYADTKKNVINAIQSWIDELDPGEGKEAAKAGFKKLAEDIKKYTKEQGFNVGNLERICAKFKTEVHLALVEAWAETPLTPADLQAMGIGSLGLKPLFLTGKTIKEKRAEFEKLVKDSNVLVQEAREKAKANPSQPNIDAYRQVCKEAIAKYSKLEEELLPFGRYPEFAGLYSRVVGEHIDLMLPLEQTEQNNQKIVQLTEIRYIYAMYAAAQGNGEGMYALAEGLLNFGKWSDDAARKSTGREALKFADLAINAAKKTGDVDLSRKARILKADILAKNYLVQIKLGFPRIESSEKVAEHVVKAYVDLGVDGVPGLYRLFEEAGVSADPMIDILSKRLDSKSVKPTADEIKMITTAALAGNEKAISLLDKLVKLHPVMSNRVPILNPAHMLANQGVYTDVNAPFSPKDAFLCYEGAFVHLKMELQELSRDRKLDQAAFDRIHPKLLALQANYDKFLGSLGDQQEEQKTLIEAQGSLQHAIDGLVTRYSSLKLDASTEVVPKEAILPSPSLLARFSSAFKSFPEKARNEISTFFNTRIMPAFRKIRDKFSPPLPDEVVFERGSSFSSDDRLKSSLFDHDEDSMVNTESVPLVQSKTEDPKLLVDEFNAFWESLPVVGKNYVRTLIRAEADQRLKSQVAALEKEIENVNSITLELISFITRVCRLSRESRDGVISAVVKKTLADSSEYATQITGGFLLLNMDAAAATRMGLSPEARGSRDVASEFIRFWNGIGSEKQKLIRDCIIAIGKNEPPTAEQTNALIGGEFIAILTRLRSLEESGKMGAIIDGMVNEIGIGQFITKEGNDNLSVWFMKILDSL